MIGFQLKSTRPRELTEFAVESPPHFPGIQQRKACPFAIQNLIKIEISKMTALRDTLVYDSDNCSIY